MQTLLQTRNIDGGSSVNDATVWAHTVSARCGCLDFETHISICGVGQLQSGSDDICKRAWRRTQRNSTVTVSVCVKLKNVGGHLNLLRKCIHLLCVCKDEYASRVYQGLHGACHKHCTLNIKTVERAGSAQAFTLSFMPRPQPRTGCCRKLTRWASL